MIDAAARRRKADEDIRPIVISANEAEAVGQRTQRMREAASALLAAIDAPGFKLPMLPEVASEAVALANDPSVAMNRLERVIVRDPVLAARVLAVASSPAYGGVQLRTLGAALQRLGTGTVRDILYQGVMECHVFRGSDERAARVERDHAVAVGRLAKALGRLRGAENELAFLCGLLHDIGNVALRSLQGHPALAGLERPDVLRVFELAHTAAGARMAMAWKLPAVVVEAVRRHHRHAGFAPDGGGYSEIGHVIAAADRVVTQLGIGGDAQALDADTVRVVTELGADPDNVLAVARAAFAQGV